MNTTPYTRIAKIRFVPQNPGEDQLVDDNGNPIEAFILTVTQKAAPKIEDNRSGDSLAIITINEKIQSMISFDTSENMQNWDYVTLWEATDKDIPEGAVGRVRSVKFSCSTCRKAKYCLKKYVISSTWNPSKSKVIPTTRHVSFRWARKSVN